MLYLLACAATQPIGALDDTAAAPALADPHGMDGCTYDYRWESAYGGPATCSGAYDSQGRWLGESCISDAGQANFESDVYDANGCQVEAEWYVEFGADIGGGSWDWKADFACDNHANAIASWDRTVQIEADGSVLMDESRAVAIANTYAEDLWTRSDREYTDSYTSYTDDIAWTYTPEGWIATETLGADGGAPYVTTYTRDANGNPTEIASEGNRLNDAQESVYTYDDEGRRVDYTRYDAHSATPTETTTLAYQDRTMRYVEEEVDDGGDGTIDAVDRWDWTCP